MRNKFWDKRIPTLLGLLLIIFGIGMTSYLVSIGVIFTSKAGPSQIPKDVRVTNVSDNAFTVIYDTDDNVFGSINYGENGNLTETALDDRDQLTRNVVNHKIHSITAKNLTPSTTYSFSINSGQNKYLNNNSPYTITTGIQITATPSAQKPISGKVITDNGNAPSESVILVSSGNSQIISALVKNDGTFLLPLNSMRSADFLAYYSFPDNAPIKMLAIGDSGKSNVSTSLDKANPVPTITLGNDYNFITGNNPVSSQSAETNSSLSFPIAQTNSSSGKDPSITSPQKDQGFTDQQPTFEGTGTPNQTVQVTIHSDQAITDQVKTDSSGNWQYRPSTPLSPGTHTISITTKGADGILKTITQSFMVYASGTQVTESATPSGQTSSPSPTPTPTPTPTLTPTPTPITTPLPIASETATPLPTPIPTSTPVSTISANPIPSTGSSALPLAMLGIFITIVGGTLFFGAKKGII